MSEYHQIDVEFQDEDTLKESLEAMGYKPQVHKLPVNLEGYHGDKRKQKAHIIIPRRQVGGASNDVGFEKTEDGKYILHLSEYDQRAKSFDLQKLKQIYGKTAIEKAIKAKPSKFFKKSEEVDALGNIRMKIRVRS